ncbi:MAG: hypothetical protein NTZ74_14300 [Chloroflexi bacterium]|nr:hypothetical protein [Chloroflexota bacterium]
MKISTGLIIVIISMVFFYLRIAYLRGRKKRYERDYALKRRRVNGRSKGAALPKPPPGTPPYGINNWILVGIAVFLVIFGLIMYNKMTILSFDLLTVLPFLEPFLDLWYIPTAGGVVLLAFCVKIEKPILDE